LVHEGFKFGGFTTWPSWSVHHGIARWIGGLFCEKMKFVVFDMWGLEWATNVNKWIPWKSWCTKVLSSVGFAHDQVGQCTTTLLNCLVGYFCEKIKFVAFEMWWLKWLTKVPKMNTIKFLVHESFEIGGFGTWPSWSVHHDTCRWLGGLFC